VNQAENEESRVPARSSMRAISPKSMRRARSPSASCVDAALADRHGVDQKARWFVPLAGASSASRSSPRHPAWQEMLTQAWRTRRDSNGNSQAEWR
jgi:hypothetical protein